MLASVEGPPLTVQNFVVDTQSGLKHGYIDPQARLLFE